MARKKQNLKEHVVKYYDYISFLDIVKLNKEYDYGCTIKECKEIHSELYEWS